MQETVKNVVIFALGAAVGGLTAYFLLKKPLEEEYKKKKAKCDEEIASMDAYLAEIRSKNISEELSEAYGYKNSEKNGEKVQKISENEGKMDIKSSENGQKYPKKTDYSAIYKRKIESEHPTDEDDLGLNLDEKRLKSESLKANEVANSGYIPEVITEEEYRLGRPDFNDSMCLLYYPKDDILATEQDQEIENPYPIVGDLIKETGFDKNNDLVLYVRNYGHRTDYEIDKCPGFFDGESAYP